MQKLKVDNLILFSIFALPMIINPVVALSFDEIYLYPKLWWGYGVIFPCVILFLWRYRKVLYPERSMGFLPGLALYILVSTLFFHCTAAAWFGLPDRFDGTLMHLIYIGTALAGVVWYKCVDPNQIMSLLARAVITGGGVLASTSVLQQIHVMGVIGEGALAGVIATPFGGFLGHRGYMGGCMALLLPITLWISAGLPKSRQWWGALAVALIIWAWLGSATRGAWLAGGAGLLCLLVLQRRSAWRQWWPIALGALLFAGSNAIFHNSRALSLTGENGQALADSSGRTVLWNSAVVGIKQKPLLGWGTPSLLQAMNARPSEQLLAENGTRDVKSFRKLNLSDEDLPAFQVTYTSGKRERVLLGGGVDKVHNEYLDYALTYGLPVALAFVGLLGWAIWSGRAAAPGISAGLVAYAVYLFTWPEVIRFAPIAWFFMGVALAAGASTRRAAATVQPCPSPPSKNGTPSPGSSQEAASRS